MAHLITVWQIHYINSVGHLIKSVAHSLYTIVAHQNMWHCVAQSVAQKCGTYIEHLHKPGLGVKSDTELKAGYIKV